MADLIDTGDGPSDLYFEEYQDVSTVEPVPTDEGRTLPAGSQGTIIDASPVEGWFHVEFMAPFHCIVGLWARQMSH